MVNKAFVVGVNTLGLEYCTRDAQHLSDRLEDYGYQIISAGTSKTSLQAAFESLIDSTTQSDTLLLYFSGHGLLEKGKLWFLLADDASKLGNKINLNEWLESFSECRASNKLVILDCCHASQGIDELRLELSDRYLVLAASARLEKSIELESLKASFFTHRLCQALEDLPQSIVKEGKYLSVQNLYEWLLREAQQHNGQNATQVPLPKLLGSHADFALAILPLAETSSNLKFTVEAQRAGAAEPEKYASRADYLAQLINRYQDLDFVGIPELKDRENLLLQDVFIPLQTSKVVEREVLNVEGHWIFEDERQIQFQEINIDGNLIVKHGTVTFSHPDLELNVNGHVIAASPAHLIIEGPQNGKVNISEDVLVLKVAGEPGNGSIDFNAAEINIGGDVYNRLISSHPRYSYYLKCLSQISSKPFATYAKRSTVVSAYDAIKDQSKVAILGDPGSGKTTLLKYVAVAFARGQSTALNLNEERLPIFVRLYDYTTKRPFRGDRGFSLVDHLYVQARENLQINLEPGFFEKELEQGKCCVCLDGLDELGESGLRREVIEQVSALVNRYPENRYLVTSRIVGYLEAPLICYQN